MHQDCLGEAGVRTTAYCPIFAFDHGIESEDTTTQSNLFDQGSDLLEGLISLKDDERFRLCPTILVAHSLGGLIVKKAICLAYHQLSHFYPLINSIAGVILMGTPHSRSSDVGDWSGTQILLKFKSRYKKRHQIRPEDAHRLAELSCQFEEAAADLPILSMYETELTAVKGFAFTSSKLLLVGESLSRLRVRNEQRLAVRTNHYSICNIDVMSPTFRLVCDFVQSAVAAAQSRIDSHLEAYVPPPILDSTTIGGRHSPDSLDGKVRDISSSQKPTLDLSETRKETYLRISDFAISRKDPQLPCHIIPFQRNKNFYGRTEALHQLDDFLVPSDDDSTRDQGGQNEELRTFALCGQGGVGKTQIATEFAYTHTDTFDVIIWLHAEESSRLETDFGRIAIELGLALEASQEAKDPALMRELVKGWLTKPVRSYNRLDNISNGEASWLLIYDNAQDRELLEDFWPPTGSTGSVLITSRDPLARTKFYLISDGIDLQPFGTEMAAAFLLNLTWRSDDENERNLAVTVAERLGGLPLALTQMASVMIRQVLSFEDFLARYEEEEARLSLLRLSYESRRKTEEYPHTVASVWALESLQEASGLLDFMALLDPESIPEEILQAVMKDNKMGDYPSSVTAYQHARTELVKSSLISIMANAKCFTIHRLVQDVALARMSPERLHACFSACVTSLTAIWPSAGFGIRHDIKRWPKCEELAPHVLRLEKRFKRTSEDVKRSMMRNIDFANLLNELGWYFQERSIVEEARDAFSFVQANLKTVLADNADNKNEPTLSPEELGKASFLLAETYRNLGCHAAEINQFAMAKSCFETYNTMMIDKFHDTPPGDDPRLMVSYVELATAHIMIEDWPNAVRCNLKALEAAEKLTDPFKAKQGRTLPLTNLACTYMLSERIEDAGDLLYTALREREELFGSNDRQSMLTGRVLHGLGNWEQLKGNPDKSLEFHARALLHFKETVGNHHHRTADMCFKVAEHYARLEESEKAITLLDQALKTYAEQPYFCAERARAWYLKGKMLVAQQQQNESKEAKTCFGEAVRLFRLARPDDGRPLERLGQEDFNNAVIFWSR
ncbi:hypothetical protein MW887_012026 [Aspergillus wentii]|nr:hypothetical protein MW887_012026 [Aspergillus wentii]